MNDNSSVSLVKLHATPVFAILNNHIRREERQTRVIGTLLGVVNDDQIDVSWIFIFCFSNLLFIDYGLLWRSAC